MRVKYEAARETVSTHENTKDPEGSAWTLTTSGAAGLVVTDSDSRSRGVLGRRFADTINEHGGHHEQ